MAKCTNIEAKAMMLSWIHFPWDVSLFREFMLGRNPSFGGWNAICKCTHRRKSAGGLLPESQMRTELHPCKLGWNKCRVIAVWFSICTTMNKRRVTSLLSFFVCHNFVGGFLASICFTIFRQFLVRLSPDDGSICGQNRISKGSNQPSLTHPFLVSLSEMLLWCIE